jgi:hypothetical protein
VFSKCAANVQQILVLTQYLPFWAAAYTTENSGNELCYMVLIFLLKLNNCPKIRQLFEKEAGNIAKLGLKVIEISCVCPK